MCGVVGIVSSKPVNQALFDALTVMQHRGQDAAGIVTWGKHGLKQRRSNGLVRDVFRHRHMLRLRGKVGIGHVRYPTAGGSKSSEAQPFYVNSPYGICLAHNGNLTNHDELAELLIQEDRRHLSTDSDSEVLLNVFAHELHIRANGHPTPDQVFDAVEALHKRCKGGYAVVALIVGHGVVAFRDPNGIRPLVVGERKSDDNTDYMVASESVALDVLQFDRLRDVKPGETIFIENSGRLHSREHRGEVRHTPCIFEYVYFARPDSILDDISVYKARLRMGEQLAGKIVREFPDHDIDVVIPNTGHQSYLSATGRLSPGREVPRGIHQEPLYRQDFHHAGAGRARGVCAPQAERDRPGISRQECHARRRLHRTRHDFEADNQARSRSRRKKSLFCLRGAARAVSECLWHRYAGSVGVDRERARRRGDRRADRRGPVAVPGSAWIDPVGASRQFGHYRVRYVLFLR